MGVTSEDGRIVAGGRKGTYVRLAEGSQERHVSRTDLAQRPDDLGDPILTVAHLSDLHVCDHQSPARAEVLDRLKDPDTATAELIDQVGTYRAQELLTAQVGAAMVEAVNEISEGPVGGGPLDLAITTGDSTDNGQLNELDWYLTLLDGGRLTPDSGDMLHYEGVDGLPDERFWHPEGGAYDRPRGYGGFPLVPGLLKAMRRAIDSPGLEVPWLAVNGNHDALLQGTIPTNETIAEVAVGALKAIAMPEHWTDEAKVKLVAGLVAGDPEALTMLSELDPHEVTPDKRRRQTTLQEFIDYHVHDEAKPAGHGFSAGGKPYYRHDANDQVTFVVLDTVNPAGGFDGSLDEEQLEWLDAELASTDRDERLTVIASHHDVASLVNDMNGAGGGRRVLGDEIEQTVSRHESAVLWLNGHTHRTAVRPRGSWWEVTAPSLVDWPQQGRVVELLSDGDVLTIATTMLDHAGPARWSGAIDDVRHLASLSRELSANDWQGPKVPLDEHPGGGSAKDRNVMLHLLDPRA
ncbi:metallophosphoesterase (TIGR03767 family) [Nocardioides albertanoniae]|uniref:Metallophosphoesterase (TIGR03767 family) n=1 Tax=Nocardioides albertanoniae TaxID=1175486 RepID=A0A543A5I6_9ACTN|nr:TIGR03767 family metallophosphoesterase [Nocardioides albertanoniae]TQL67824.1 metallophosphoesterase (TIGR03767 family) [Nocardioides albertanoniae]